VFKYSIVYLMALFAFLLADHWIAPPRQPSLVPDSMAVLAVPATAPVLAQAPPGNG